MNIDDKMKNSQVAKQLEAATAQAMAEDSKEGKALSKEESETLDKLIDEHMRSDNPDEVKIAQKYSDFLSELKDAKTGFADVKKSEATQKSLDELNLDDKEQWTQIEPKQTKKVLFFGKDGYSFKTSNGVEVKVGDVDDIETVQVYENKQTGKVVVLNAKGATIDSSADNADISIYNSEVEKIKTKSGVDYVSLNNSKLMSGALDKEDLAIENGDYLKGIDISKMPKVQSDEKLTLQSGEEIAVSDYIELITKQEVGFDTEKEYQQYAIQALKDNLESMKLILATQSEQDGVMAKGYNKHKELTGLGISTEDAQKMIEEQEAIIAGLTKAMNGEGGMSFDEAYAKYTGVSFSPEKAGSGKEKKNSGQ